MIRECIKRAKETGLKTVVCAASVQEAKAIAKFSPDCIAFEDPELIGTLKSVSKLEPETLKEFVQVIKKINPKIIPLCGAGIATSEDVKAALRIGTNGILLATAVVKSKNPAQAIKNLEKGFHV